MNLIVIVFLALIGIALSFQVAMMAGAPFGHLTMGGFHRGVLPPNIRLLVALSASLTLLCALVVLTRAGWVFPAGFEVSRALVWVVVGYFGLGVVQHIFTPSYWERVVWLPQILGMLLCTVLVALN